MSKRLNDDQANLSPPIQNLVSQTANLSFWSSSKNILKNGTHPNEVAPLTIAALTMPVAEHQKVKEGDAPSYRGNLLPKIAPPG